MSQIPIMYYNYKNIISWNESYGNGKETYQNSKSYYKFKNNGTVKLF
jgi:hypothetical protein